MFGLSKTRREPAEDDLRGRVRELEAEVKALRLEWTDVLDKVLHRLQRQAKRDRDAIRTAAEAPGDTNGSQGVLPYGGSGSARLDALRARRNGGIPR